MPADLVNLRQARKARARVEKERQAEANRLVHGRTRAEKTAAERERAGVARKLDQHRREPGD